MKKVKFGACTKFMGSTVEEVVEVEDDMSDAELDELAEEWMWQNLRPECWHKVVEADD